MSLVAGIAVLALAVLVGGLAALLGEPARWALSPLRTFAVVAAASIALLHLLPEAIAAVGCGALAVAALGALGPIALERALPSQRARAHEAPTTALAMGYAAVVAHQAGEGAALASLAETGGLSLAIVLAIAAHTVPLSMVVALRVAEARSGEDRSGEDRGGEDRSGEDRGVSGRGGHRAIGAALLGVAAATAAGAAVGSLVGGARLATAQPWLLAAVAGLLLHALSHDAAVTAVAPSISTRARLADTAAGWAGLALATLGVERGGWLERVPTALEGAGIVVLAGAIAARSSFVSRPHGHVEHRRS